MNKTCKNKCSHYFNLKGDRNTHFPKGCSILLSIIWNTAGSQVPVRLQWRRMA